MATPHFDLITSTDALKALIDKLMAEEATLGFDLETGYLGPSMRKGALQIDWDEQFVCGFSITNSENWARYVPLAHDYGENLPEAQTWELMKPVLETLPVIAHGSKFEIRNLRALERKGRGPRIDLNVTGDTILQSYALSRYQRHGLKGLVKAVFGYDQPEITSLFPDAKKKDLDALRFNVLDLSDPKVVNYACEDAIWPLRLNDRFLPQVTAQRRLIYELEMRVLPVLCDMEDAGHAVDWDAIREASAVGSPFEEEMKAAAKALLSQMAGEDLSALNLASTPQMREVLYSKIGLRTNRKTDKGEMSTDAIALEALSREHPAVKKVLEVREVHNLTNRMDKWLTEYTAAHDTRVHASFNQVVVGSGRFSANEPAIQQCCDGETEVLTPGGWIRLDLLPDGFPVAQHLAGGAIEFVMPERVIRQPYDGEMIHLRLWGREFVYTPNHRVVTQIRGSRDTRKSPGQWTWAEETAAQWMARGGFNRYFTRAGHILGGRVLDDEEERALRLAVAVQADGWVHRAFRDRTYALTVMKERKRDQMLALGLTATEERKRGGISYYACVPQTVVDEWLDEDKQFRIERVLGLSERQLQVFLDEALIWDGDSVRRAAWVQHASRRRSIDTVQAAAALTGHSTLQRVKEVNSIEIGITPRERRGVNPRNVEVWTAPSDGMVFCVTVPSGRFLSRRSGCVLVTGNCPRESRSTVSLEYS